LHYKISDGTDALGLDPIVSLRSADSDDKISDGTNALGLDPIVSLRSADSHDNSLGGKNRLSECESNDGHSTEITDGLCWDDDDDDPYTDYSLEESSIRFQDDNDDGSSDDQLTQIIEFEGFWCGLMLKGNSNELLMEDDGVLSISFDDDDDDDWGNGNGGKSEESSDDDQGCFGDDLNDNGKVETILVESIQKKRQILLQADSQKNCSRLKTLQPSLDLRWMSMNKGSADRRANRR
jgi:hypothetical protein